MASGFPYRDASLSTADRVADLLPRMTLAEKAGLLFHNMIMLAPGGSLSLSAPGFDGLSTETLVTSKMMSHFNLIGAVNSARDIAAWYNTIQSMVLKQTRLGIPVTISSDPRNHFSENVATSFNAGALSQWPETLGFAALRDTALMERFANIARQEYVACGIRLALHPQLDLATEPRWCRLNLTFGEDADLATSLGRAYIRGFQGGPGADKLTSVSCVTKHFPGGGPQKDGEDAHFPYGREQIYPGGNFEYHLKPFYDAIEEGTRWMMPYYGLPIGLEGIEEVGFGFNKSIVTDLLKDKLGYKGIVLSDWGLVTDSEIFGNPIVARAWGCEHLSAAERVKKILDAGCDQMGGESQPELVIKLVEDGILAESRLDESVKKLLVEKFELGLFDNPYIDADMAEKIAGRKDFRDEGELTQRRSMTLLTNKNAILPIQNIGQKKVYVEGIDRAAAESKQIQIVSTPQEADLALLRLRCPYEPRKGGFESLFLAGSLEFTEEEKQRQAEIFRTVPTVVDMYLDRPAVIPEIADQAAALIVNYGANINAFWDVVTGVVGPEGRLPFDMPRSMEAIRHSREDVPFDTVDPVFKYGHGLSYSQ